METTATDSFALQGKLSQFYFQDTSQELEGIAKKSKPVMCDEILYLCRVLHFLLKSVTLKIGRKCSHEPCVDTVYPAVCIHSPKELCQ